MVELIKVSEYYKAITKDASFNKERKPKSISRFVFDNPRLQYGKVSYSDYSKEHVSQGWLGRKIIAIPMALWTGICKTVYHLAKTVFHLFYSVFTTKDKLESSGKGLVENSFRMVRDLQAGFGHFVSLFHDSYGSYHVQASAFHHQCYDCFSAKSKYLLTDPQIRLEVIEEEKTKSAIAESPKNDAAPKKAESPKNDAAPKKEETPKTAEVKKDNDEALTDDYYSKLKLSIMTQDEVDKLFPFGAEPSKYEEQKRCFNLIPVPEVVQTIENGIAGLVLFFVTDKHLKLLKLSKLRPDVIVTIFTCDYSAGGVAEQKRRLALLPVGEIEILRKEEKLPSYISTILE